MQLFPSIDLHVGPGGFVIVGENELGPRLPGLTTFSVGVGSAVLEVVGVVDVVGASSAC